MSRRFGDHSVGNQGGVHELRRTLLAISSERLPASFGTSTYHDKGVAEIIYTIKRSFHMHYIDIAKHRTMAFSRLLVPNGVSLKKKKGEMDAPTLLVPTARMRIHSNLAAAHECLRDILLKSNLNTPFYVLGLTVASRQMTARLIMHRATGQ